MSIENFNKGLDDAFFRLEPNPKGNESYWEGYLFGDAINTRYDNNCPPGPESPEIEWQMICEEMIRLGRTVSDANVENLLKKKFQL